MVTRPHFQKLVERARLHEPLVAAVVYPCDRESLQVALTGAFAGYLNPTLVGPDARIRETADKSGLDIARLPIVDTADDPQAAGRRAAELARAGDVAALIRGSLSNEDLLAPGRRAGVRAAHRAPPVARVLPRPARPAARPAARRRAHERDAEPRGQARHRAQHDPARDRARHRDAATSRCWRPWTDRRRRSGRRPTPSH